MTNLYYTPGHQESEIKGSAGPCPLPGLQLLMVPGDCWLAATSLPFSHIFIFTWSLYVLLCPNLSSLFFCKDASHIELDPHLTPESAPFN